MSKTGQNVWPQAASILGGKTGNKPSKVDRILEVISIKATNTVEKEDQKLKFFLGSEEGRHWEGDIGVDLKDWVMREPWGRGSVGQGGFEPWRYEGTETSEAGEQREWGPKKWTCPESMRKETWEDGVERKDLKMKGYMAKETIGWWWWRRCRWVLTPPTSVASSYLVLTKPHFSGEKLMQGGS